MNVYDTYTKSESCHAKKFTHTILSDVVKWHTQESVLGKHTAFKKFSNVGMKKETIFVKLPKDYQIVQPLDLLKWFIYTTYQNNLGKILKMPLSLMNSPFNCKRIIRQIGGKITSHFKGLWMEKGRKAKVNFYALDHFILIIYLFDRNVKLKFIFC